MVCGGKQEDLYGNPSMYGGAPNLIHKLPSFAVIPPRREGIDFDIVSIFVAHGNPSAQGGDTSVDHD